MTTMETLLDRIQIEDMLYEYYALLGRNGDNYNDFFTEDSVLDVNGRTFKGRENIHKAYATSEGAMPLNGKFHMLLSNPRIKINGNTATADMIWTGILADNVRTQPRVVENGREHDELVKQGGKWLFKLRVITADSGLPPIYDETYIKR